MRKLIFEFTDEDVDVYGKAYTKLDNYVGALGSIYQELHGWWKHGVDEYTKDELYQRFLGIIREHNLEIEDFF